MNGSVKITIVLIIILLVVGCISQKGNIPPELIRSTQQPTFTHSPTFTSRSYPTKTSTNMPTWTPPSKLSEEETLSFITEMVETNGGCNLPCWWGVQPGISNWDDVRNSLVPVAKNISDSQSNVPEEFVFLSFENPDDVNLDNDISFGFKISMNNIIEYILVYSGYFYNISETLEILGEPDQILFYTNGLSVYAPEFYIILFYPDDGIFIHFFGETYHVKSGSDLFVNICLSEINEAKKFMILWSQDNVKSIDELNRDFGPPFNVAYQNIDLISDIGVEDFYQLFRNQNGNPCFKTDVNLWIDTDN